MNQCLDLPGRYGPGAQLAQFRLKAWVSRNVNIGWKRSHCELLCSTEEATTAMTVKRYSLQGSISNEAPSDAGTRPKRERGGRKEKERKRRREERYTKQEKMGK